MQFDFMQNAPGITMPAGGSFAVTPSDALNFGGFSGGAKIRAITIGGVAGVVMWRDALGVVQTTSTLPVGNYPMIATGIMSTGTTATGITAWY